MRISAWNLQNFFIWGDKGALSTTVQVEGIHIKDINNFLKLKCSFSL